MAETRKKYLGQLFVQHSSFFHPELCHPFRAPKSKKKNPKNFRHPQIFVRHLFPSSLSTKAFFQWRQQINPFEAFSHQFTANFIFLWISPIQFAAIFIVSIRCKRTRLECRSYVGICSPSMQSQLLNNWIELWCVSCVHLLFFNLHLDLITLNAFSKVNSTYGACTSTFFINFWFMFTYNL